MTYRECYEEGRLALEAAHISEAALDARLLLEHVCGTDRNTLLAHGDREVPGKQRERYGTLIAGRARRVPLQHLTGTQDFMGLTFLVNEHVLIPRQDTEILTEEVLRRLHDGMGILDLCTGSGCIIISLLHYSNWCRGVGADISREALELAERNAGRLLAKEASLEWVHSDLFEDIQGKYDVIVSNPPYIPSGVIPTLMPEVREHEPLLALDGHGDGLYFYRKITAQGREYLSGGGMLYFEVGFDQGPAVASLMEQAGFAEIQVVKDYGGLDRVVYGTWK